MNPFFKIEDTFHMLSVRETRTEIHQSVKNLSTFAKVIHLLT